MVGNEMKSWMRKNFVEAFFPDDGGSLGISNACFALMGIGIAGLSIAFAIHYHTAIWELAASVSGIVVGWCTGVLISPFSKEDKQIFNKILTGVAGVISGFVLGKLENAWEPLIKESAAHHAWIALILTFVTWMIWAATLLVINRVYQADAK